MVSDDKEMCEVLNTFFSSVFTNESNSRNMMKVIWVFQGGCDEISADIMVNKDIMAKKLEKLKLNKTSAGFEWLCS